MSAAGGSRFFKLSGAGNDFIALAEPGRAPSAGEIRAWCRRGLSLGADGVFTLERREGGARMAYFNADGGRGELCLNGSRCGARLAFHLGWGGEELSLETDAGVLAARRAGRDRIALELPPIVSEPELVTIAASGRSYRGWFVSVGVPHLVLPWRESLAAAPVASLGPTLRAHPDLGEAGANVDFAHFTGGGRCQLRTFERGVEAETLACGTGVVATAAAGRAAGLLDLPAEVLTAGGYELTVRRGEGGRWELEGDARILARGEVFAGAGSIPPSPSWS